MQFDHMVGRETRRLMQIVDVLGDDGRDLAGAIERGERAVAASGPGGRECRLHGKAPPPGFVARVLACHELVERDRPVAGPQSARRAEVGNAAFGRDAGAGERNDDGRRGDHLAEPFHAALQDLLRSWTIDPILLARCSADSTVRRISSQLSVITRFRR